MTLLLDTNVLSETRKAKPEAQVLGWLENADSVSLYISVLTLGELRKGVESRRRTDSLAADRLALWVDEIETTFADRIVPIDGAIARLWGELSAGRSLPVVDTLIAATALSRGMTLVTRNTKDMHRTGVPLFDPWQV